MKFYAHFLLAIAFLLACGGAQSPPEDPSVFDATGLKLVVGVDRTKTFEVKPDGNVESSETGNATMKFVGRELRLPDDSKTLLSLDGDTLRSGTKSVVGTFQGNDLAFGDMLISVKDNGVVTLTRSGTEHKMRMHFDGSVVGHKHAALMIVAVVFALSIATHPSATFDQFLD